MSIELMLQRGESEILSRFPYKLQKQNDGHIFSFFVMVVAAAGRKPSELGLAIILTVFKNRQTLEIDEVSSLQELKDATLAHTLFFRWPVSS